MIIHRAVAFFTSVVIAANTRETHGAQVIDDLVAKGRSSTSGAMRRTRGKFGKGKNGGNRRFSLRSNAFEEGGDIPVRFTCDGRDISPPLYWTGIPDGTVSLLLTIQDPEGMPDTPWTHWVLYNIPTTTARLRPNVPKQLELPDGSMQGLNSWATYNGDTSANGVGYRGMCPGEGDSKQHTYLFILYALDVDIDGESLTIDELHEAMEGHIIESTTLTAFYQADRGAPVCNPVGVYDAVFRCEDGGNLVGVGGVLNQIHEVFDAGNGFINLFAQLPVEPPLQFNFTLSPYPGETNRYIGAVSWINYYPGSLDGSNYPPDHLPPLISIQLEFDEDCNYWTEWMTQRPGFGRGGLSENNLYTPPTHPCHTKGVRRSAGQDPEDPFEDGPLYRNTAFLGNYEAELTCFVGENGPFYFSEAHEITRFPASEGSFYRLTRTRDDDFMAIDVLSQNGLHRHRFHGATQNVTGYNMEPTDPAWFDEHLIPLAEMEIEFHRGWNGYEAVLLGQRPGIGEGNYPNHVCRISATRIGHERVEPEQPEYCNPEGRYDSTVACHLYRYPVGTFPEDHRVRELGSGFYHISFYRFSAAFEENLLRMEILAVEDPSRPGGMLGSMYWRPDYVERFWNTTEYPLYMPLQLSFDGPDDGNCDRFNANLQGFSPVQGLYVDVVHYCTFDSRRVQSAVVVDNTCQNPGRTGCRGACFEGETNYMTRCVAGQGLMGAPNFVTNAFMPHPIVLAGETCADLGFTNGDTICPDAFYGRNDVCFYTSDADYLGEMLPSVLESSPYLDYFAFPWDVYWRGDNPQCDYIPPEPPLGPPERCPIAGRYNCPLEICVNGTEIILDGSGYEEQLLLIHERGFGYFDMEVPDNPFGLYWHGTMYQKPWEPLTITGAMYNVSNHVSTFDNPDHQMLEAHFFPESGCNFQMILLGYTSVSPTWYSPVHMCNFTCSRIRN